MMCRLTQNKQTQNKRADHLKVHGYCGQFKLYSFFFCKRM